MALIKKYDKVFLVVVIVILIFGFFVLSSASLGLAVRYGENSYYLIFKQIFLAGSLGFFLFFLTSRINYKMWKKLAFPFFILSFLLTLLVFVPSLGLEHGGARRWLNLGNFSFQPAELLKFAFVVYLSSWLAGRRREIISFKNSFLPFLIIVGLVALSLVLQPDIGTLFIICLTSGFLFFLAGGKMTQVGLLILLGFIAFSLLIVLEPYRLSRALVFFDSSFDLQDTGYQLREAKIALGSGGFWGRGLGKGVFKFQLLPEPTGDSIFPVLGEELGFAGAFILIALFMIFFLRVVKISLSHPDTFAKLLVMGLAILITGQSLVNMYAMTGLIPLTGLPLIFFSQGGSAFILALAEVGVILNISRYS
jgi:cell division protein FtsW